MAGQAPYKDIVSCGAAHFRIKNGKGLNKEMRTLTGADIICECLIEQGVDTVFGYPGGAVLNIYDSLYAYSDKINHIITAHEQGASHAADGYSRATGRTGVVRNPDPKHCDTMRELYFYGEPWSGRYWEAEWIEGFKRDGSFVDTDASE